MNQRKKGYVLVRWPAGTSRYEAANLGLMEYRGPADTWVKEVGQASVYSNTTSIVHFRYFSYDFNYTTRKVVVQTETILMEWEDEE